jgi:retron-type reverse transcriptase
MSSGTYFPPPVRAVEIPKGDGKIRKYKKLRKRVKQGVIWLERIKSRAGKLFAHWIPQPRTVG